MVDPKVAALSLRSDPKAVDYVPEDPWQWWNKFRAYADYKSHYFVALEMTADLPSTAELLRWTGEPVQMLVIPTDIFISNSQNYPVLSRAHKSVLLQFLKYNVNVALKANVSDIALLRNCIEYLKYFVLESDRGFDEFQRYLSVNRLIRNQKKMTFLILQISQKKRRYFANSTAAAVQ